MYVCLYVCMCRRMDWSGLENRARHHTKHLTTPPLHKIHPPHQVLWVDNMGQSEGLLEEFRAWFADSGTKKVWHNYGFDRHVLFNHGVDCLVRRCNINIYVCVCMCVYV